MNQKKNFREITIPSLILWGLTSGGGRNVGISSEIGNLVDDDKLKFVYICKNILIWGGTMINLGRSILCHFHCKDKKNLS